MSVNNAESLFTIAQAAVTTSICIQCQKGIAAGDITKMAKANRTINLWRAC